MIGEGEEQPEDGGGQAEPRARVQPLEGRLPEELLSNCSVDNYNSKVLSLSRALCLCAFPKN